MGFFVLLILIIGIVVIVSASNSGKGSAGGYHSGYIRNYDEDEYEDYETRAAMGERNYFTDDSARDYDSYYAQVLASGNFNHSGSGENRQKKPDENDQKSHLLTFTYSIS